jgi:hypothetical protein
MSSEFARVRCGLYRKSSHKARIVTAELRSNLAEHSNVVVDWDESLIPENQDLSLHNSHEASVYRGTVDGRTLEIPLVYNRATRTYYAKFTTSSNPNDPPDISVAGSSPEECFDRVVGNPHWKSYLDRFAVDDSWLRQSQAASTVPPAAPAAEAPTIAVDLGPYGTTIGVRPGSSRPS